MNDKVDLEHPPVANFANIPLILNAAIKKKHFIYGLLPVFSLLTILIIDHVV